MASLPTPFPSLAPAPGGPAQPGPLGVPAAAPWWVMGSPAACLLLHTSCPASLLGLACLVGSASCGGTPLSPAAHQSSAGPSGGPGVSCSPVTGWVWAEPLVQQPLQAPRTSGSKSVSRSLSLSRPAFFPWVFVCPLPLSFCLSVVLCLSFACLLLGLACDWTCKVLCMLVAITDELGPPARNHPVTILLLCFPSCS